MIVYNGLKSDFLKSVEDDTIALEIEHVADFMSCHGTALMSCR